MQATVEKPDKLMYNLLNATQKKWDRNLSQSLTSAGISYSQYCILELLCTHGNLSASQCYRALGKSTSSMTKTIDHLEKLNFLRRSYSHPDRRYIVLEITPEGKDMTADTKKIVAAANTAFCSGLSHAESEQFTTLCEKLLGRSIL